MSRASPIDVDQEDGALPPTRTASPSIWIPPPSPLDIAYTRERFAQRVTESTGRGTWNYEDQSPLIRQNAFSMGHPIWNVDLGQEDRPESMQENSTPVRQILFPQNGEPLTSLNPGTHVHFPGVRSSLMQERASLDAIRRNLAQQFDASEDYESTNTELLSGSGSSDWGFDVNSSGDVLDPERPDEPLNYMGSSYTN